MIDNVCESDQTSIPMKGRAFIETYQCLSLDANPIALPDLKLRTCAKIQNGVVESRSGKFSPRQADLGYKVNPVRPR